jgi:cytochrome c nitrite reductase small subunit
MPFDRYCFECHRSVAHGERGISLLPYQHIEEK